MAHQRNRNGRCDARFHLEHRLFQADEDGAADDAVADVELFHFGEARDRPDVLIIQAVAGMQFHSGARWLRRRRPGADSSSRSRSRPGGGVGVAPGVKLDRRRAQLGGGFDLLEIGIDEQRDIDARVAAARQGFADTCFLAGDVQASFGCQLGAALGNKCRLIGFRGPGRAKRSPARGPARGSGEPGRSRGAVGRRGPGCGGGLRGGGR